MRLCVCLGGVPPLQGESGLDSSPDVDGDGEGSDWTCAGAFPSNGLVIMRVFTLFNCPVSERTLPVASPVEIGADGECVLLILLRPTERGLGGW